MESSFNKGDLRATNAQFKMLNFYPSDPETQAAIMALLARMVPHKEALEWLTSAMVDKVGRWHGPAELRGVLCWRYKPADGIEMDSCIPGFTAADGERLSIEQHAEIRRLERATDFPKLLKEFVQ